jgi:hypothetical protein
VTKYQVIFYDTAISKKEKRKMNLKRNLFVVSFLALAMSFSPVYASGTDSAAGEKPEIVEGIITTVEATVEAVDQKTRKVTLKDSEGKSVTIEVGEEVKNLPQVEVGDLVTVEYLETVAIKVFAEGEIEPGAAAGAAVASAEAGQKPAGVAMEEVVVVTTIEAIDKEKQLVTLKTAEGESKTVKARNPENLEKVQVGDQVMITYTTAMGISVTEKASQ